MDGNWFHTHVRMVRREFILAGVAKRLEAGTT
jgi:hypothetical protein